MWDDFVNHLLWWALSGLLGIALGWLLWGRRAATPDRRTAAASSDAAELRAALAARDVEIADLRARVRAGDEPELPPGLDPLPPA